MRAIKIDYNYNGKPTITKQEYLVLKESIKDSLEPNKPSILNKGLTKKQAFDIMFNDNAYGNQIEYLPFFNIVREFVVKKKTFHNWKIVDTYKPIKEIQEIRKEKLTKLNND